jgi:hypothetical protein
VGQQGPVPAQRDINRRRLRFASDWSRRLVEIHRREAGRVRLHLHAASDDARDASGRSIAGILLGWANRHRLAIAPRRITVAKTPKVSGGGFYQIGEPKERPAGTAKKAAKAVEKIERARRKIGKALEPRTSITIKRGTKG